MLESLLQAFTLILSGEHFLYLIFGVFLGIFVGILPGLGGIVGFSVLMPFIYGMDPVSALAMLIGLIAVVPTSDTFTSVFISCLSAETVTVSICTDEGEISNFRLSICLSFSVIS